MHCSRCSDALQASQCLDPHTLCLLLLELFHQLFIVIKYCYRISYDIALYVPLQCLCILCPQKQMGVVMRACFFNILRNQAEKMIMVKQPAASL